MVVFVSVKDGESNGKNGQSKCERKEEREREERKRKENANERRKNERMTE